MKEGTKKIGTIILTVYLTVVTICCGLFGYLYFSTKVDKDGKMSLTDAKVLVDTVCTDMGLKGTTSSSEISANVNFPENMYDDWNETTLPMLTEQREYITAVMLDQGISSLNTLLEYDNLTENTYYELNSKYYSVTNKEYVDTTRVLRFNMLKDRITIDILPGGPWSYPGFYDSRQEGMQVTISGTPSNWEMIYKIKGTYGAREMTIVTATGTMMKENNQIYYASLKQSALATKYFDGRDDLNTKISSVDEITNLQAIGFMETNLKTHKNLSTGYSSTNDYLENMKTLTKQQATEIFNELVDEMKTVEVLLMTKELKNSLNIIDLTSETA